jgi:hypothetical protein
VADVTGLYRRFGVRLPSLSDGWATARCFTGTHQDRHPSARVHLSSGGFRCFTCGAKGGVLDALQLLGVRDRREAKQLAVDYGILDPPKTKKQTPPPAPPPPVTPPQPEIERVDYDRLTTNKVVHDRAWVYTDQHGTPVGRVHRLDHTDGEKRIWQERPDNNNWAAGLNGAHLPLYRLPEVLERAHRNERVLIVEGEKAVDALDRLGFFATTNAGGAGKWRPEHTLALTGATILVICDCDQPGRHHAYNITQELLDANIHALTPFDPAPLRHDGYDIVDHLAGVAETVRVVTPGITDTTVRDELHHHLRRLLSHQLRATAETLRRWHEHNTYLADPTGRVHTRCPSCGQERLHRVSHGLAFCPCGAHQPAPTPA